MPRWLGAVLLIAIGIGSLVQAVLDPHVTVPGISKRALPVWASRVYLGVLAAFSILGGVAVYFGGS